MAEIINLAKAVVTELVEYGAELLFVPEFELKELNKLKVVVVPAETEYKTLSRSVTEKIFKISVGILKRTDEAKIPDLMELSENICKQFQHKRFENFICFKVENAPIYSIEHFRERRQFTSVITLSFKVIS